MLDYFKRLFAKPPTASPLQSASYSTPSINQGNGRISLDIRTVEDRLIIESDNWRDTEFVHASLSRLIDQEFQQILSIHRHHKAVVGWNKVHLRERVAEPIGAAKVPMQELPSSFPGSSLFKGVAYYNTVGVVDHGVAFATSGGLKIYGQYEPDSGCEFLTCICFEPCSLDRKHRLPQDIDQLSGFASKHQLYLVCWNRLQKLEPETANFLEFFEKSFHT